MGTGISRADWGIISRAERRLLKISDARTVADMRDNLEFLSNWSGATVR